MRFVSLSLFVAIVSAVAASDVEKFAAPSPERLVTLLHFPEPITLQVRAFSAQELARKPKRGVPLAAWYYSNPAATSQSFTLAIFRAGDCLRESRPQLAAWIARHPGRLEPERPRTGIFPTADGRALLQFPGPFGPGGSVYIAILACADSRFEIVMSQSTAHDDDYLGPPVHHVAPRKELRELIEAVERLLFRS